MGRRFGKRNRSFHEGFPENGKPVDKLIVLVYKLTKLVRGGFPNGNETNNRQFDSTNKIWRHELLPGQRGEWIYSHRHRDGGHAKSDRESEKLTMARDLTKEKVVQKAAELANQLGDVHQLTLKALAAALNIKVPSLYNHIKGIDGLMYALRIHALTIWYENLRDAMAGKIGREALWAAAQSYRSFAHANPGIYQLILPAGEADSEIDRIGWNTISLLLLILGSFGLEGDEALHVVRGFRSLVHGFVSLELAGGFGLDLDLDQSFAQLFKAYLHGLNMN